MDSRNLTSSQAAAYGKLPKMVPGTTEDQVAAWAEAKGGEEGRLALIGIDELAANQVVPAFLALDTTDNSSANLARHL